MTKRIILVSHKKVVSWLYVKILPELKDALDAKVMLLLPEGDEVPASFESVLDENDIIKYVPSFSSLANPVEQSNKQTEAQKSILEKKYDVNLFEDILMQERDFATFLQPFSRDFSNPDFKDLSKIKLVRICDQYVNLFEKIFHEHKIVLSLVWARSCWESIVCVLSHYNDVLATHPRPSKGHGNLAYWSDGMFANSVQIRDQYKKQKHVKPYKWEERSVKGRPEEVSRDALPTFYTLKSISRRLLLAALNRLIFFFSDLKRFRFQKRKSMFQVFREEIANYFYWKKFKKLCVTSDQVDFSKPFAFFAFNKQPEYAVEGRCKEFNDQFSIVLSIANALPSDAVLYIKEHAWVGNRDLIYYQTLLRHPLIKMLLPTAPSVSFVKHAQCVCSLNGSVLFESSVFGVPCAYFSKRSEFSVLSNSYLIENLSETKNWIRAVFSGEIVVDPDKSAISARRYISAMQNISFEAVPLYTKIDQHVPDIEIKKSVKILLRLLRTYRHKKELFNFKFS